MRLLDCSHIAHRHPLEAVNVRFGGYDLLPNFWLSIFRQLLTLIDGG